MVVGIPAEWADLIVPMVPVILNLVVESWDQMPVPEADEKEDDITVSLFRILKRNKAARELPFRINIQRFELEPLDGAELGRQDIVFEPLHPCEDIYFCLESKRLNVIKGGSRRTYASEYVTHGMLRFVTGQYSKAVQHGGMLGYVLNGDFTSAMKDVEKNIKRHSVALCMRPPGAFVPSTMLKGNPRAKETSHKRAHENVPFFIHHVFMPATRKKSIFSLRQTSKGTFAKDNLRLHDPQSNNRVRAGEKKIEALGH